MFLISGPKMVIESCKSGVIGSFPFTNARTLDILENWIVEIKSELKHQNCKTPWAANIITHSTYGKFDGELELISKYKPPIVITALGSPKRVIETVKKYGGLIFADVSSIKYAKKCAETNIDGLVLVCTGAGGHTGNLSPFVFIKEVRKFWKGKIILAGGISDGTSIKSAIILGADYAYMGTRFLACNESMACEDYNEIVINATFVDIIIINYFCVFFCYLFIDSVFGFVLFFVFLLY
ncbi:MAG: NAD(P)H-dependent flavin oxidoreductase, partial [Tenacibaculum sp.]